jgi:hypothetical protein
MRFLKLQRAKSRSVWTMTYQGDVHDTPPLVIRVAMTAACAFGAVVMLWHLISGGYAVPLILTASGLAFALYLVWIVPRASQTAMVTVAYWVLLAYFAFFLPMR